MRKSKTLLLNTLLVLIFVVTLVSIFHSKLRGEIKDESAYFSGDTTYEVVRVIDGDTLIISLENKEESVRLIGIDAPESVDPRKKIECFGKESADEMRKVAEGRKVKLENDPSQGTYDKYGRLLSYVFKEDGIFLNQYMLEKGFAYEYTYFGIPYKYQKEFKEAKNKAKAERLGLWAKDACK